MNRPQEEKNQSTDHSSHSLLKELFTDLWRIALLGGAIVGLPVLAWAVLYWAGVLR